MSQRDMDERVAVKTYVPREQKQEWVDHADELGMTLSEFVRTMVQSGRSPFELNQTRSADANPRGNDLKDAILDVLREQPATFDRLSEEIIGELEIELDETLQAMDQVTVSGRTGEYRLIDQ